MSFVKFLPFVDFGREVVHLSSVIASSARHRLKYAQLNWLNFYSPMEQNSIEIGI
jgi:hypothetical protein